MKPKTCNNIPTKDLIKNYFEKCAEEGRRPTIREVAKKIGIVSTNTVHYHMNRIGIEPREKKFISKYGNDLVVLREKIVELLGGKCCRCGFSDIRALQIDHVNGGGGKQRKDLGGNRGMYITMIKELEGGMEGKYQLLCANCNWIKKKEKGEQSHTGSGGGKWGDKINK